MSQRTFSNRSNSNQDQHRSNRNYDDKNFSDYEDPIDENRYYHRDFFKSNNFDDREDYSTRRDYQSEDAPTRRDAGSDRRSEYGTARQNPDTDYNRQNYDRTRYGTSRPYNSNNYGSPSEDNSLYTRFEKNRSYDQEDYGYRGNSPKFMQRTPRQGKVNDWGTQGAARSTGVSPYASAMDYGNEPGSYSYKSYKGVGPKNYKRSNSRIEEDICERLMDHDEIDAKDISIEVSEGKVTLSGSVSERWMKHMAEDIADSSYGVDDVENHIRVSLYSANDSTSAKSTATSSKQSTTSKKTKH